MLPIIKEKKNLLALLAAVIVFGSLALAAADPAEDDYLIFSAEWETRNRVRKQFETPLGMLYRFDPEASFPLATKLLRTGIHPANCRCSQCTAWHTMSSLQCVIPRKAHDSRYLAIDFIVRQFPAFEKAENRVFDFAVTQSDNTQITDNYFDLNARLHSHLEWYESIYQNQVLVPDFDGPALITTGAQYRPKYEPQSIRIIFDNQANGPVYVIINGERLFVPKYEGASIPRLPLNTIGFCVEKSMEMPVVNIELSPPRLIAFDREEVLLRFLDGKFQQYPYSGYHLKPQAGPREKRDLRKMRNSQNPDFHYATAMSLLYGTDPEQPLDPEAGVKLLKRAMRDDHVFAIYQLGVCYLRGLGVGRDNAEALNYFTKADDAGYVRASAMAALTLLRQHQEDSVVDLEIGKKILARLSPGARLDEFCVRADRAYLNCLLGIHANSLEYSYRELWSEALMPENELNRAELGNKFRRERYEKGLPRFRNTVFPKQLSIRLEANENENQDFCKTAEKALRDDLYAPAGYALAQYWSHLAERERPVDMENRIDRALELSAAGGFLPAVLMQYERALAAGRPVPKLTPQFEFTYADEPWFLFLRFAEKNPEHPAVKAMLRNHYHAKALELLKNDATPDGGYLLGLLTLMHPDGPLGTTRQRINPPPKTTSGAAPPKSPADADPRFEFSRGLPLKQEKPKPPPEDEPLYGAETFALFVPSLPGNPDACYLIGKLLLQNPDLLPAVPAIPEKPARPLYSGIPTRATMYLARAAEAGNLKARYLLARSEPSPVKAIELLKPLRDAGITEAWLLTADIQAKQYGFTIAVPAYQRAAALGSPDAYSILARNTADPAKKRALWQSFLTADKRQSLLDPLDTYSPKEELRQHLISSDLLGHGR